MFERILKITGLMVAFWVVFNGLSFFLARFYMPWIKENLPTGGIIVDLVIWLGVLITLILILLLFKKLFYILFQLEISKSKIAKNSFNNNFSRIFHF